MVKLFLNYYHRVIHFPYEKLSKLRFTAQDETKTCAIRLFENEILFCKRAGSVGVNAIKHYLKRVCLLS